MLQESKAPEMIVNLSRKHRYQILHTQVIYAISWVFNCSRCKGWELYTCVHSCQPTGK